MNYSRSIGRYFADEWQAALNNSGAFYTPTPSADMTITELQAIAKTLQDLVTYWQVQIVSNTNTDAIANSQAIADLEQSKLNVVNDLIRLKSSVVPGNLNNQDLTLPGEPITEEKSWLPILLIGAAAIYFFTRKKKRA